MLKHWLRFAPLCFVVLAAWTATAQEVCPIGVPSDKLICLIPQVYGVNGLPIQTSGPGITPHFQNVLPDSLRPLNSAIARESGVLPLASPSSGISFSWDSTANVFVPSTDSFGPILGDRAETVGRSKTFLGFSYQYFNFDNIDGIDLGNLPSVFLQQDDKTTISGVPRTCSVTGDSTSGCGYIRDAVTTTNKIGLTVHQFTTFITFGVTSRVDVSAAIPIETVRMSVSSNATIINNSNSTGLTFAHTFDFRPGCGSLATSTPCANQSFASSRTAAGIGDITLRVKGVAWRGEHAGLALGADIRVPSGDSLNFLGAGAAGVRPFVVWSRRARISPHVSVGYQTNGSSTIAGDITTGSKERLPGQFTYSGGADVWLTKRITADVDLIGQQVFQVRRTLVGSVTEPQACKDPSGNCDPSFGFASAKVDSAVGQSTGSFNTTSLSLGMKVRPFGNLLLTGNVLIKLNDGGLGVRTVPLIGVSYTF